jgi:hypothetical protein
MLKRGKAITTPKRIRDAEMINFFIAWFPRGCSIFKWGKRLNAPVADTGCPISREITD